LKDIPLLVFVDGYDELQLDETPINLVNHLGLSESSNSNNKLVLTCRPNTVDRFELDSRFAFNGQIRYFLPFN